MTDRLDDMLASLGRGMPFPVDWEAYGRELLERLRRSQVRSRRRTWGSAAAGALSGAAAVLALSLALWPSVPGPATGGPVAPAIRSTSEAAQTPEPHAPAAIVGHGTNLMISRGGMERPEQCGLVALARGSHMGVIRDAADGREGEAFIMVIPRSHD